MSDIENPSDIEHSSDIENRPKEAASKGRRQSRHRSENPEHGSSTRRPRLQGFSVELVALLLLIVGVFLLVEQLEIKSAIYGIWLSLVQQFNSFFSQIISIVHDFSTDLEKSDMVGLILVFGGVGILAVRFRSRMIRRYQDLDYLSGCPRCGSRDPGIKRAHPSLMLRSLELILHVRIIRYRCVACRFALEMDGLGTPDLSKGSCFPPSSPLVTAE